MSSMSFPSYNPLRSPWAVSVNPSTNVAYVANADGDTVSVIDGKTNTIIDNITVGTIPVALSVNPLTNIVYVANRADNTVTVIEHVSRRLAW